MNDQKESFSRSEAVNGGRESFENIDLDTADPSVLLRALLQDVGSRAVEKADVKAVEQQVVQFRSAEPLSNSLPADPQSHPEHFVIVHYGVNASSRTKPAQQKHAANVVDTGVYNPLEWTGLGSRGTLSNLYTGVLFQHRTSGAWYSATIGAGLTFIHKDLFDGEFTQQPLIEAVNAGVVEVVPPGLAFDLRRLSPELREKSAEGALAFSRDPGSLRWHAALVPGTQVAKMLLAKADDLAQQESPKAPPMSLGDLRSH